MNISNISLPEVYTDSEDFRFFCKWFETALSKVQYDTENLPDIYDPLKCSADLLWMLADTMGFKFDSRLPVAFNRLVLIYFMSMIRNRGSKDGVTLAAETNLAQFNILEYGKENDILYNRLEDTSIPVNAAYVTPHTPEGYIDVVYFSKEVPIDACIEYVRPLGMYLFQHAGVRLDARTKISIDARLTHTAEIGISIGATHVGHYRRADYASMQRILNNGELEDRNPVYYRNSKSEGDTDPDIDPGRRALYSLQVCNNEHIVKSLLDPIFGIGYTPTEVEVYQGPDVLPDLDDDGDPFRAWNLRLDRGRERETPDVYTIEDDQSTVTHPVPAVNPIMHTIGDAISLDEYNTEYIINDDT